MQDRKSAFLNGAVDRKTVSPDRLENPASRYVVQAGAVIPAALITGIRSDLPGQVTAQVTENVYDSPSGRFLLIPQGSKLFGAYDSQISFGQDRVLLVWTRLIMPSGRSIVLERQPGADTQGFTGLEDDVDQHWGGLAMAAALSTVLGVGTELGATNNDSAVVTALRRVTTDSLNQTGQQVVRRNLNIQPTITIRPGFPVRVIVNRDLVFHPTRVESPVTKLKLSAIPDDRPVKLTVELPGAVHRDLVAYADYLNSQHVVTLLIRCRSTIPSALLDTEWQPARIACSSLSRMPVR
jgi:type IV secretion system protein TrbI